MPHGPEHGSIKVRIHTGTITQIDRNALSVYLYELADTYTDEAKLWKPKNRRALERSARLLAELARGVLSGAADFQRAEAFADAGAALMAETVAQRRAIDAILTRPNRLSESAS